MAAKTFVIIFNSNEKIAFDRHWDAFRNLKTPFIDYRPGTGEAGPNRTRAMPPFGHQYPDALRPFFDYLRTQNFACEAKEL